MSSQNRTGPLPLHCRDCNDPVRKTASGTYVCTGCGPTSKAELVR